MDPSGGTLVLPAAAAFVSHLSMLPQAWVKQNWGRKSFVRSFLAVVEKQRQHFEECCDRLQKLHLTQSAMTAEFSPEEKKQLNVQMRIVLKDLEAFLRSQQNLINKIANHYRLSKRDHAQICNAIDDMNVIMKQVHTTLQDCFAFLGSNPESIPALVHIDQVIFHRQSYAAKLTRTGGPAPLRCSGNATVAEIAMGLCDRELHSRYQSIQSDVSKLVKLQSKLAMENDQRVQKALKEQREAFTAKLRASEAGVLGNSEKDSPQSCGQANITFASRTKN